jgi:hypothetical protein
MSVRPPTSIDYEPRDIHWATWEFVPETTANGGCGLRRLAGRALGRGPSDNQFAQFPQQKQGECRDDGPSELLLIELGDVDDSVQNPKLRDQYRKHKLAQADQGQLRGV